MASSEGENIATIITENNASNIRILAREISLQNWGETAPANNVSLDTSLSAASNVTVVTIANCNVGIGSTAPVERLDISGNLSVSGSILRNGIPLATTNWQQSNNITFLSAPNQLAIGAVSTQGHDIYVAGSVSASNVYARDAFFIANDTPTVRNALQLSPLKLNTQVTSSSQQSFVVVQPGIYNTHASNTDVYLNGVKLVYANALNKDYDVTREWISQTQTRYTITLSSPAVYGDVVDICVWPTFFGTNASNLPGYVYQTFGDYQWSNQGVNNVFKQGNVGVGTTAPLASLHVHAGNVLQTNNVQSSSRRYPPLFLTANTTTFFSALYGNGTYTIQASNGGTPNSALSLALDGQVNTHFYSGNSGLYNLGVYQGTTPVSVTVNSIVKQYSAHDFDLTLPVAITVQSIYFKTDNVTSLPSSFVLLGTNNNGASWDEVNITTGLINTTVLENIYTIGATKSYSRYKFLVTGMALLSNTRLRIQEFCFLASETQIGVSTMVISPSGQVGLGTTVPQEELHIHDNNLMTSFTTLSNLPTRVYPPVSNFTSNAQLVTSQPYGNGYYNIWSTNIYPVSGANDLFYAFDGSTATSWTPAGSYSNSFWNVLAIRTLTINGVSYFGPEITIHIPTPIVLTSFEVRYATEKPKDHYLFGSSNNVDWTLLYSSEGNTGWVTTDLTMTYAVTNQRAYGYYKYIVPSIQSTAASATFSIIDFKLFGYEQVPIVSRGVVITPYQLMGSSNDSVTQPSFSFHQDSNTGLYHPRDDAIGFAANDTEVMRIMGSNVSVPRFTSNLLIPHTAQTADPVSYSYDGISFRLSHTQGGVIWVNKPWLYDASTGNATLDTFNTSGTFTGSASYMTSTINAPYLEILSLTTRFFLTGWRLEAHTGNRVNTKQVITMGSNITTSTWTLIDTYDVPQEFASSNVLTRSFTNTTQYHGYRAIITSTYGNLLQSQTNVVLSEVRWLYSSNLFFVPGKTSNVGIGLTNPMYMLDVAGDVQLSGSLLVNGNSILANGVLQPIAMPNVITAGTFGSASLIPQVTIDTKGRVVSIGTVAAAASQWTTSGANIYILSANVGVGTASPVAPFHVQGNLNYTGTLLHSNTNQLIVNGVIQNTALSNLIANTGTYGSATTIPSVTVDAKGRITSITSNAFTPTQWTTSGTNVLVATGSNVGIGTNTALQPLHVQGSVYYTSDIIYNGSTIVSAGVVQDVALANINAAVGTWGNSTTIPVISVDAKGRITNISSNEVISSQWTTTNTNVLLPSGSNVGIGTTNALHPLHVVGNVFYTGNILYQGNDIVSSGVVQDVALQNVNSTTGTFGSATSIPSLTVDTKGRITNITSNPVVSSQWTTSGGVVLISSNVGINTAAAPNALTVTGSIQLSSHLVRGSVIVIRDGIVENSALSNAASVTGTFGSATSIPVITVDTKGRVTNVVPTNIPLSQWTTSGTSILVPSGSNVGIGTTTALQPLHVSGNIYYTGDIQHNGNSIISSGVVQNVALANVNTAVGTWGSTTTIPNITVDAKGRVTNVTSSTIVPTQWTTSGFNISYATGNVGINSASPAQRLDVGGNINYTGNLLYAGTSLITTGIIQDAALSNVITANTFGTATAIPRITVDAKGRVTAVTTNAVVSSQWNTSGATINYMTGNVGIGTATPTSTLHVQGTIFASGDITGLSDRRVKDNLTPIREAIQKLTSITGYTYTRKDETSGRIHAGLVAQEVQNLLPEVVIHDTESDQYSINYGQMAAFFVEAIKDLHARVDALERKFA